MKACLLSLMLMLLSATLALGQFDPMMPGGMPPGMGPGAGGPGGGPAMRGGSNDLRQLQAKLAEEQKALDVIEAGLRQSFEREPEWQEALAARNQAQAEHDAARQAVLGKLYETPEYKAALDNKFSAETALQNLTGGGSEVEPEALAAASNELMETSSAVRELEDDALAADPSVAQTKQKLTEATARLNELRKKFKESLELNLEYLTQSDRVEDTKFKLAEARQRNAEQMRQKSNTNRNRTPARRPSRGSGPRGGGPPGR